MGHASKDTLDKAHEMGIRDGKAGGIYDEPRKYIPFTEGADVHEENDAYRRGHEAGKNQSKDKS